MEYSLLLSRLTEQLGQSHWSSPERDTDRKNLFKEEDMYFLVWSCKIPNFSSVTDSQRQELQESDERMVVDKILSASGERPINSSRITSRISGTSCWVLKSNWMPRVIHFLSQGSKKI